MTVLQPVAHRRRDVGLAGIGGPRMKDRRARNPVRTRTLIVQSDWTSDCN